MNTNQRIRLSALVAVLGVVAGCSVQQPPSTPTAATAPALLPAGVQYAVTRTAVADPTCVQPQSYPTLPASTDSATLDAIRKRGRLIVGASQTGYGLSYLNPANGQMEGFEVDIIDAIATALFGTDKNTIDWVSMEPDEWPAGLTGVQQSGQHVPLVDMALGAMTMTCGRWKQWDFSTEYLDSRQLVMVKDSSPIQSMVDIGGRKVCSANGSTNLYELVHGHYFPKPPVPVGAASNTDCMLLLQQNRVDAVFTSDVILAGLAAQDRTVKLLPSDDALKLPTEPVGIGIRTADGYSDHGLTRFVNGVLAQFRGDGRADRADTEWVTSYDTWLAPYLGPAGSPPTPLYLSR